MKTLKDLGEFGLIAEMRKRVKKGRQVLRGIGDDTAVLKSGPGKDLLFTTDILIENKHFRLREATPFEIGRKAIAVNVSDIAAMGGVPTHAVVAVGLPTSTPVSFARELQRGLAWAAKEWNLNIVGGDTNAAESLVVSVAMLGEVESGKALTRSGAKVGDVLFVTGWLGGSYDSGKHLNFTPRLEEARYLTKNFKIHAMMDVSDGIASDIHRLAAESRVGAFISEEALPLSPGADLNGALTDGEDFELLFTMSVKDAARLSLFPPKGRLAPFRPIGKIVAQKEGVWLKGESRQARIPESGFRHF